MSIKINNIQALRAFAAVSVAVFHTGFAFPGMKSFGWYGVDVFFVISGYLMARICETDSQFFLRRRLLRILPPYWTATVILFFAALFWPQLMQATRPAVGELLKSFLFIPYVKSNGLIQPLLFLGWTLNLEMYFYVVLGISLLVFRRHALWLASMIILVVTFACSMFAGRSIFARFYSQSIILEFVLGMLVYFICRAIPERSAIRLRMPMLALLMVSAIMLVLMQGAFPQVDLPRALTLGVAAFTLVGSASLLSQGGWDTKAGWLILIGDASYILYLIHPFCELLLERTLSNYAHWLGNRSAPGFVISIALVISLSVLIHLKLERPTIRYLNRKFGGKRVSAEFFTKTAS